ncbi:MAG TPA: hypothetical protein VNS32_28315, partial [Flavisolibacter sp.]|nr:hypothetical protein [Flavisolibacter sp.]
KLTKTLLACALFILSSFASAFIFQLADQGKAISLFLPGLIFTAATILVFLLFGIKFKAKNLVYYILMMYITYLVVYILTYSTVFVTSP